MSAPEEGHIPPYDDIGFSTAITADREREREDSSNHSKTNTRRRARSAAGDSITLVHELIQNALKSVMGPVRSNP